MTDDQLRGWKEIATFLGTSERTAQRWESELQLPVHRLSARPGASVFALRPELVVWRSSKAGRVAARQEAERSEREKNLAASAGRSDAPAPPGTAETPGSLAQPIPSVGRRRFALILVFTAGIFVLALLLAWFTLPRAPVASPQATPPTAGPVRLRISWPDGPSMLVGIPDGGTGRLTVAKRLIQFAAKRMDGTVKVQVSEVLPVSGPEKSERLSFLGQFGLQPGAAVIVREPSPFTIEWVVSGAKNPESPR